MTRLLFSAALVLSLAFVATGCSGDVSSDQCRLNPADCGYGAGALCERDDECGADLFCCTEDGNCGGGMCTQECDSDKDCPLDMLCEHDMCFYMCESDRDCADDMSCEHGNTICEYD